MFSAGSSNISSLVTAISGHSVTWDEDTTYIATGSTVSVYVGQNSNDTVATYTTVVKGDVDGDGEITSDDIWTIQDHVDKYALIESGTLAYLAADVDGDGDITSADLALIS